MSETETTGLPGSAFLWRVAALGLGGAGVFLLGTGRGSTSLAILFLVAGLAAAGVLLGGGVFGLEAEGRLDLSARLGLGLLGGGMGALVAAGLRWLFVELDVADGLGVLLTPVSGPALLGHIGSGAIWGMVLGILFLQLPGAAPSARGALFSLIPSLYVLLWVYPSESGLGLFGVELGTLTFLFVIVLNLVWGWVAGATIGWGELAKEGPVSRPIDA